MPLSLSLSQGPGGGIKESDFITTYTGAMPPHGEEFDQLCQGFLKVGQKVGRMERERERELPAYKIQRA